MHVNRQKNQSRNQPDPAKFGQKQVVARCLIGEQEPGGWVGSCMAGSRCKNQLTTWADVCLKEVIRQMSCVSIGLVRSRCLLSGE